MTSSGFFGINTGLLVNEPRLELGVKDDDDDDDIPWDCFIGGWELTAIVASFACILRSILLATCLKKCTILLYDGETKKTRKRLLGEIRHKLENMIDLEQEGNTTSRRKKKSGCQIL